MLVETTILKASLVVADWRRMFIAIPKQPSALNNIVIQAQRDTVGGSKITIDDLIIQDCDQFGM